MGITTSTTPENIIRFVCKKHNVPKRMLKNTTYSHNKKVTEARQEVMYKLYTEAGLSLNSIAYKLSIRTPQTVRSGIHKHCIRNSLAIPNEANLHAGVGSAKWAAHLEPFVKSIISGLSEKEIRVLVLALYRAGYKKGYYARRSFEQYKRAFLVSTESPPISPYPPVKITHQ